MLALLVQHTFGTVLSLLVLQQPCQCQYTVSAACSYLAWPVGQLNSHSHPVVCLWCLLYNTIHMCIVLGGLLAVAADRTEQERCALVTRA